MGLDGYQVLIILVVFILLFFIKMLHLSIKFGRLLIEHVIIEQLNQQSIKVKYITLPELYLENKINKNIFHVNLTIGE